MSDDNRFQMGRRGFLSASAVAMGGIALSACTGTSNNPGSSGPSGKPKVGGTFRFGSVDSSSYDSIDAAYGDNTYTNTLINNNLYSQLVRYDDKTGDVELFLAESVEPAKDLSYWDVRLNEAEFHNGKPVTADDVIYTMNRFMDPKIGSQAASHFKSVDMKNLKKLDDRTVRINLTTPDASIIYGFRQQGSAIVPVDYDPKQPVGCGPFKFKSFSPGQQTVLVRNENFWRTGPYLDELRIIGFADPGTTRVNALTAGQIDGANQLPFALVPIAEGSANVKVIVSDSFNFNTFEMRTDTPPFDDPRVRQAIMLIADRQQIVDQAYGGSRFAQIGNDLPSRQDPLYNSSITQRTQDIEKAKALLREAGQENLTITLTVSNVAPGVVETAQVLAQQAKEAGVTINVNNVADSSAYFTDHYFQDPFKFDYFPTLDYWSTCQGALVKGGSVNLSSWDDAEWNKHYFEGRAEADESKRKQAIDKAQQIQWERGSQAVFAYYKTADAYSTKFTGFYGSAGGRGLNGLHFDTVSLA